MSKSKLFIENILVYGLGGVISKLIPLLMLPVITRLMPGTEYFGLSDLSNTVVQFGSAVAVIGMYDAMYRMFFDKEDSNFKKAICSTALFFTIVTSLIVGLLMLFFKNIIAEYFFGNIKYDYLVYISAITVVISATNNIISAPTRMQNKRKVFLITNTLSPLLSYLISIPLILMGHYIIALPIAAFLSGASMEIIFYFLNKKWFKRNYFDKKLLKPLLCIAVPLFPNFLIYWVFNSSDKIMITNLIGIGAAGIYSVGSKLGHASQLIYTAFAGGWQYFAFSTMKDRNQVETNSRIYEYLGMVSFIAFSLVCAISYEFYSIFFSKNYLSGYIIAPYLFMAPLLQMLYQIGNNQFLVIKKTWPGMFILLSGAIVNITLNFILIPKMGIEGAAIATLLGYFTSVVVDMVVLYNCKLMRVRSKFYVACLLEVIFLLAWRMFASTNLVVSLVLCVCLYALFALIYMKELKILIKKIKERKKKIGI